MSLCRPTLIIHKRQRNKNNSNLFKPSEQNETRTATTIKEKK
jgi:hypothetical protein